MKKEDYLVYDIPQVQPTPGMFIGGFNPMFIPRRGKYKGYMKENKRCSFNKNR